MGAVQVWPQSDAAMDVLYALDTGLAKWRHTDFSLWPREVLQQKNLMGPKSILSPLKGIDAEVKNFIGAGGATPIEMTWPPSWNRLLLRYND